MMLPHSLLYQMRLLLFWSSNTVKPSKNRHHQQPNYTVVQTKQYDDDNLRIVADSSWWPMMVNNDGRHQSIINKKNNDIDPLKSSIEILLEPIRYSMAFLTLFSIMSTIIVAIVLVPLEPLQLLAQLISLIVSLSGLLGTLRRSILLSSIYALSMLLFLFLQSSYFFVLLKLVQEVRLSNSNSQKLWYNSVGSAVAYDSNGLNENNNDYLNWQSQSNGNVKSLDGINSNRKNKNNSENGDESVNRKQSSSTLLSLKHNQPPSLSSSMNSYYQHQQKPYYFHPSPSSSSSSSSVSSASVKNDPRPPPAPSIHVRRISVILSEELSYLSLLTVPMIAWLPPSLFMETVAVLLLSMQAVAAACFLYALNRSLPPETSSSAISLSPYHHRHHHHHYHPEHRYHHLISNSLNEKMTISKLDRDVDYFYLNNLDLLELSAR